MPAGRTRQPLLARWSPTGHGWYRSWHWAPGGRNKDKAKRRSARRERARARASIQEEANDSKAG